MKPIEELANEVGITVLGTNNVGMITYAPLSSELEALRQAIIKDFVQSCEPLGEDFQKVLYENLDSLYEN